MHYADLIADTDTVDAECNDCEWDGELEVQVGRDHLIGECPECGVDIVIVRD